MGDNIRKYRKEKGLSWAKPAEAACLPAPAIRLYELGKRTPKEPMLARLACGGGYTRTFDGQTKCIGCLQKEQQT